MNRNDNLLKQFNHITNELSRAINQKNYAKAKNLTLKQRKLMESFDGSGYDTEIQSALQNWELALNRYHKLRKIIEADLKRLNTNTRENLKRLKGYAQ